MLFESILCFHRHMFHCPTRMKSPITYFGFHYIYNTWLFVTYCSLVLSLHYAMYSSMKKG